MSITAAVAELNKEIARLDKETARLVGLRDELLKVSSEIMAPVARKAAKKNKAAKKATATKRAVAAKKPEPAKKRAMSAEAKKRIGDATRARWAAKRKAAGK